MDDKSKERELCTLIGRMGPEQVGRYLTDPSLGFMVANHISFCTAAHCKKLLEESHRRAIQGATFIDPSGQWKEDLSIREMIYIMKERGIYRA